MAQKIRKGDTVVVVKGKDRGKSGAVQRILTKESRALVEGVNVVKRHQKARPGVRQAGVLTLEAPISVANVKLLCPHCHKAVRVGFKFLEDGKKVRVCHKCQETIG
ncbi:MAG: 50S ribosomal protein L24 [Chloroflexi bacterium]|nr:50S ribosomal protein L24 [Chloroflexota bacterium]